jgi:hypothetical protein
VNILDAIPAGGLVVLDTVVWIDEFEANPVFGPITRPLFEEGFGTGLCRDQSKGARSRNVGVIPDPSAGWPLPPDRRLPGRLARRVYCSYRLETTAPV